MSGLDRRGFLRSAAATSVGLAGVDRLGIGRTPAVGDIISPDTQFEWVQQMVAHGPRFPGNWAHRRYLDDLQGRLESFGLPVTRYPVPLDGWWARFWSLRVTDANGRTHRIPVAYYRPHSGQTLAEGLTAPVLDVGAGTAADYQNKDARGRVVLADFTIPPLKASVLFPFVDYFQPPSAKQTVGEEDYTRVAFTTASPPSLELAQRHGAVAMIDILNFPPEEAAGQYAPHQQEYVGLPTLHLDQVQGKRLRDLMTLGPLTATVVLDAEHRSTTVDYLVAGLPGSGRLPGAVMLGTHTDGQNAIEENGGPAILALAERFTRIPQSQRPRDMIFVFSPNHMCATSASIKLDTFLTQHPEIKNQIRYAIVPEHLGTMNWTNPPTVGAYGPTGRSEITGIGVGNSTALESLAINEVQQTRLDRVEVLRPFAGGLYGEGTLTYLLGIPTVQYISGPTYLVQVAPDAQLDKINVDLMHRQTAFLAGLTARTLALPA